MGFGYITYTACAYFGAMTLSFFLNLYFTFSVRGHLKKRMLLFFSFNLLNLLNVEIIQYFLIEYIRFNDNLAILTGMGIYTLSGFFMNYYVVYRQKHEKGTIAVSLTRAPGTLEEQVNENNQTRLTKKLYVCADDYAQNTPVSEGILHLIQHKRINATSCLVNLPHWAYWATRLLPHAPTTFIGLHLNLTLGEPLSQNWRTCYGTPFKKLPWLMLQTYSRRLRKDILKAEIEHQLKHFTDITGFFPDFIDGHEHIHQFPIIRDILLEIMTARTLGFTLTQPFFCRSTTQHWHTCFSFKAFPKRALIALLGGLTFKKRLREHQINSNLSFSGIYNFKNARHYRCYFQQFLQEMHSYGLIMCHPGFRSQDTQDPLHQTRAAEMNYFMSDDYLTDLKTENIQLLEK